MGTCIPVLAIIIINLFCFIKNAEQKLRLIHGEEKLSNGQSHHLRLRENFDETPVITKGPYDYK